MTALFAGLAIAFMIVGAIGWGGLWYRSRQAQLWRRGIREEENEEPTTWTAPPHLFHYSGDTEEAPPLDPKLVERLLRIGLEPESMFKGTEPLVKCGEQRTEIIRCWLCNGTGRYERYSGYPEHAKWDLCDMCEGTGLVPKPIDPGYTARDAFPEK